MAQLATVDQQRELMRYMGGLNDWLARDVQDRQAELRAVTARIDQLRDDLGRMGPVGAGPGWRSIRILHGSRIDTLPPTGMRMPEPAPQQPGGFGIQPPPPGVLGPVPPVVPLAPYPPVGVVFGPQPPVIPAIDRSLSDRSPVIPEPWGMPEPRYGGPMGPVRPAESPYEEYPPSGPSEYVYHPQEIDELAIPSPPSQSDMSREPLPVPGPGAFPVPHSPAEHESRSSTPTQESYRPPYSPAVQPIPPGPAVVPMAPPGGGPQFAPQQTVVVPPAPVPPPGHLDHPLPIIVQASPPGPLAQGAIPMQPSITFPPSGMPIPLGTPQPGVAILPSQPGPGTIVINPPAMPVPESYGPSRASSRSGVREPVVVVQSSPDRLPVQIPATVVQVPPSVHTHHEPIPTSPSIRAIHEHEVSRSPSPRPRHRYRRRSRSYSPDDYYDDRPERYRYPEDRHRYRDRDYSPGYRYRRYDYSPPRRRRSYDYESPEGRPRRRHRDRDRPEREGDEDHSPEDPGRRRPERRPSRRSEPEEHDLGDRPHAPLSQREGDPGGAPHPTPSHTAAHPLSPAPPTIIRLGPPCMSLVSCDTFHIELVPQIAPCHLITPLCPLNMGNTSADPLFQGQSHQNHPAVIPRLHLRGEVTDTHLNVHLRVLLPHLAL